MGIQSIFFLIFNVAFVFCAGTTPHGSFKYNITGIENCKGPRHRDCVQTYRNIIQPGSIIIARMDVLVDTQIDMMRLLGYKGDYRKNSTPIVQLEYGNPCKYPLLQSLIPNIVNGKICVISKGQYNYTVNSQQYAKALWADSFFYGNFTFKSIVYGRNCNFDCTLVRVTFMPKDL